MAVRFDQAKHLDHLARATALAMSIDQFCEYLIIILRPQSPFASCCQRFRADERARLTFQHVEIMFEIEHLLMTFVAPVVTRD